MEVRIFPSAYAVMASMVIGEKLRTWVSRMRKRPGPSTSSSNPSSKDSHQDRDHDHDSGSCLVRKHHGKPRVFRSCISMSQSQSFTEPRLSSEENLPGKLGSQPGYSSLSSPESAYGSGNSEDSLTCKGHQTNDSLQHDAYLPTLMKTATVCSLERPRIKTNPWVSFAENRRGRKPPMASSFRLTPAVILSETSSDSDSSVQVHYGSSNVPRSPSAKGNPETCQCCDCLAGLSDFSTDVETDSDFEDTVLTESESGFGLPTGNRRDISTSCSSFLFQGESTECSCDSQQLTPLPEGVYPTTSTPKNVSDQDQNLNYDELLESMDRLLRQLSDEVNDVEGSSSSSWDRESKPTLRPRSVEQAKLTDPTYRALRSISDPGRYDLDQISPKDQAKDEYYTHKYNSERLVKCRVEEGGGGGSPVKGNRTGLEEKLRKLKQERLLLEAKIREARDEERKRWNRASLGLFSHQ
ncbi:unnamed protein product [Darwinula stevensoni]|uniref:Uncharacterized protein n=1 Tax=Darwinula stevensoni TaxID=69355 RepID=A0A7R8X835_9CRUS|nr:unnamed protein product [Darwinula stevensoni]CAG0882995.1 unnamed protein product [Darwinula stevensoni]